MAMATRYTPEMIEEYVEKGYWERTSWPEVWGRNARDFPSREAIVDSRRRFTWSEANRLIDRLAIGLKKLGFKRDEVLAIQLPNSIENCLLRLACEKAGIICLTILTALRHRELEYILKYVEASGIVIPWRFRNFDHFKMIQELRPSLPKLRHVLITGDKLPKGAISIEAMLSAPLKEEHSVGYLQGSGFDSTEVSWISHTTGTTGFPKFVEIPACARMNLCKAFATTWRLTGDDIIGALSPHTGGPNIIAYWSGALVGAKLVLMERFEAEDALRLIEKEKITALGVVPTMFTKMITHPNRDKYDLSSVRLWVCAGGTPPYQLSKEVEERIGGRIVQIYGAVDWGGGIYSRLEASQEERLLTAGKPIPGHEIRLVDESGRVVPKGKVGELQVKGPAGVGGYYKDPAATRDVWSEDGWYKTGDMAKVDDRGNVVIVGRKKDMIKRGGENIYPIEIESILETHPKILHAAIVRMPDPLMGERACAYVTTKEGKRFSFEEMVAFLREKGIATFKLPERLEIIESMPMVEGVQKIDKKVLEKDIVQKLKAEGQI